MDKENVMNKPFMEGLKLIKDGIELILSANEYIENVEKTQEIEFPDTVNNKNIAIRVAETYNTFRPELGADRLANDIIKMAENPAKVGFLVNWMRKKGINGFEWFFKLTKDKQQSCLIIATTTYRKEIVDILKDRFQKEN